MFMYNVLSAMFNALGKSRIPLYLLIFSSVFIVVLDLIMVCSFHMGVSGVAWATLIAQGISAVMAFLIFIREMRSYQSGEENRWFDRREFGSMCGIALPSILQQSTVSIGMMLVQSVVNSFGAQMRGWIFRRNADRKYLYRAYGSYGNVMSSFTAQNLGAKQQERVVKGYHTAYGIVFGFGILICVILEIFYRPLILMFLGEEGTALALEYRYVPICGLSVSFSVLSD